MVSKSKREGGQDRKPAIPRTNFVRLRYSSRRFGSESNPKPNAYKTDVLRSKLTIGWLIQTLKSLAEYLHKNPL